MKTNCSYLFWLDGNYGKHKILIKNGEPKVSNWNREEKVTYQHCQKYSCNQL